MIVDLFCGIGWDCAARSLGLDPIGIDIDADVCATRALHAMPTIRADIATYPTERFRDVDGLIASPPCQDFSRAGKRAGLTAERGQLVWQVERWADALRPRWVACEQTEDVLPIWQMIAHRLRNLGYRTWVGLLHSERYGVPQTRTRAILLASLEKQPHPPEPTHQKYVPGEPAVYTPASMFHGEILPWVSMAEALGWETSGDVGLRHPRGAGMVERHGERPVRSLAEPAHTLTTMAGCWDWTLTDRQPNGAERRVDQPAPTITASLDNGNKAFVRTTLHTNRGQEPDGTRQTVTTDRPAPGFTAKAGGQWAFHPDEATPIRLAIEDALILQSFPPGFELAGAKTAKFRQIGNAVPPLLAQAILRSLLDECAEVAA